MNTLSKWLVAAALTGLLLLAVTWLAISSGTRVSLVSAEQGKIAPQALEIPAQKSSPVPQSVDVNARDENGRTALWLATARDERATVQHLLDQGADVDRVDSNGITPLMMAADRGDLDLLETFLAHKPDRDFLDSKGHSALHHAIMAGRSEALALLLDSRPEPQLSEKEGAEFLSLADESGQPEMIAAVLNHMPANLAWTPETRRALQESLEHGQTALTRMLVEKHSAPPTVEGKTTPLLAQAILANDLDTCSELLAAGVNPNTPLPAPPEKDFLAALPRHLRDYAEVDKGLTPLMVAASLGKPELVRALMDAGAEKNRLTSRYKMMALYFAAHSKNWKSMQMLLGSGPTPEKLHIEVSLHAQKASVIKDGTAIFETQCSTGRDGFSTPSGEYVITDKDLSHRSTIYKVEMPYFMRLNCLDFGMHESGSVPRYPASHGCIRLPAAAARKLFTEIPVGTVVMIN
ncbi:MAG: ankyrin repeat domain-containing protein [Verrucomicrobiota bacterium]|nr:ankyrin repeat domain-containing protein [Verrucomicrobiota bacterium]